MARTKDPKAGNVPSGWPSQDTWGRFGKPRKMVKGTERRSDVFERQIGPRRPGGYRKPVRVSLQRQPDNEHDPNAIQVLLGGEAIGFIAAEVAKKLSPAMHDQAIESFDVPAIVVGGDSESDRTSYGCWVWPRRHFGNGLIIGDVYAFGEDMKPWGSAWKRYALWPDDDTPYTGDDEDDERDDGRRHIHLHIDVEELLRKRMAPAPSPAPTPTPEPAEPAEPSSNDTVLFMAMAVTVAFFVVVTVIQMLLR